MANTSSRRAAALALALLGAVPAPTARADAPLSRAPREAPPIVLRAGKIAGTLVALDGLTPTAGARILLRDASGAVLAEAVTGRDGAFDLGERPGGEYTIEVGRAVGRLRVATDAAPVDLLLVIAQEISRALRRADGDDTVSIFGVTMDKDRAIAVGAGAAIVVAGGVAAGIAIGGSGGGSGGGGGIAPEPPSPTEP